MVVNDDISVEVEPQLGGGFRIRLYHGARYVPTNDKIWQPSRRELKQLSREGRTPYDEAVRRGRRVLDAARALEERSAALREQIARLT